MPQSQQFETPTWQQPKEGGNVFSRNSTLWIIIVLVLVAVVVAVIALRDRKDEGVRVLTEEEKREMTEYLIQHGRPLTDEEKQEMFETLKSSGNPLSKDQKVDIINALKN
jgi:flagellar biosynthesis/type III secretory pathway M-ring protein FliF/YscJ